MNEQPAGQRNETLGAISRLLVAGGMAFGCEPVGVVLVYPHQTFLKAAWANEKDRKDFGQALIDAASDEFQKTTGETN